MALTGRSTTSSKRPLVALCCLLAAAALVAGCGRSAPETAAEVIDPAVEPDVAGVQVVGDEQVVVPPPSTVPVETTVTAPPPPSAEAGTYVVQAGDTLSVIAEQFGVSTDALSQANNITDVNSIRPGQELIIPAAG